MNESLETIGRVLAVIIGTSTVIGLGAKFVLLPWIKSNLVDPVKEVNTAVTVNQHVSSPPTMLDKTDTINKDIKALAQSLDRLNRNMNAMAIEGAKVAADTGVIKQMWDHHMDWSSNEVNRIWHAIDNLQDNKENKHGQHEKGTN